MRTKGRRRETEVPPASVEPEGGRRRFFEVVLKEGALYEHLPDGRRMRVDDNEQISFDEALFSVPELAGITSEAERRLSRWGLRAGIVNEDERRRVAEENAARAPMFSGAVAEAFERLRRSDKALFAQVFAAFAEEAEKIYNHAYMDNAAHDLNALAAHLGYTFERAKLILERGAKPTAGETTDRANPRSPRGGRGCGRQQPQASDRAGGVGGHPQNPRPTGSGGVGGAASQASNGGVMTGAGLRQGGSRVVRLEFEPSLVRLPEFNSDAFWGEADDDQGSAEMSEQDPRAQSLASRRK
jgi:hypothetical protein